MIRQRIKIAIFCLGFSLVLSGCGKNTNDYEQITKTQDERDLQVVTSEMPSPTTVPTVSPTVLPTVSSTVSPTEMPVSSTNVVSTSTPKADIKPQNQKEEISSSLPKNLSTQKNSWYTIRNNEHKTPAVNENTRSMINKYGGFYVINPEIKKIYLTFDEGYENGYTSVILDTLKEKGVKATFFITGQYFKTQKELIRRMINEGHGVENHTQNHPSMVSLDEKGFETEVANFSKNFKQEFGRDMKYLRPPMGEYSEKMMYMINKAGYKTAFWSFAYDDYDVNKQKGTDYAYKMIMDNLHNGEVMLLHAVSKDNANVLPRIIDDIREKGYEIGKLM